MEKKTYSVKTRYKIYNILAWLGLAIALVGCLLGGEIRTILTWIGIAFVTLAVIYRFTAVRCPHCGHLLTESKTMPDKCPKCQEELD